MQSKSPIFYRPFDRHSCALPEKNNIRTLIQKVNQAKAKDFTEKKSKYLDSKLISIIEKFEKLKSKLSNSRFYSKNLLNISGRYKTSVNAMFNSIDNFISYSKQAIESCEFDSKTLFCKAFLEYTRSCQQSILFRVSFDAFFIMLDAHEEITK